MRRVVLKWSKLPVLDRIDIARYVIKQMAENAAVFPSPNPPLADMEFMVNELHDAQVAAVDGGKDRTRRRNEKLELLINAMNLQILYVQTVTHGDELKTMMAGMEVKSKAHRWPMPEKPKNFKTKLGPYVGSVYLTCSFTKYKKQYVFQMWDEDGGTWKDIQTQSSGRYLHQGLKQGQVCRFRVYAINSRGNGPISNEFRCVAS